MIVVYLFFMLLMMGYLFTVIINNEVKIEHKEDGFEHRKLDYYLAAIMISIIWPVGFVLILYLAFEMLLKKDKNEKP